MTANPMSPTVWRCFHCNEIFTDHAAAEEHFGQSQLSSPACKIDAAEYRRMEGCCHSHHAEDTELHRALYAKDAEMRAQVQQAEEKGYARGLEASRASTPPDATLAIEELKNLINARRFDRDNFANDTEFVDWALSRARYTLGLIERASETKETHYELTPSEAASFDKALARSPRRINGPGCDPDVTS